MRAGRVAVVTLVTLIGVSLVLPAVASAVLGGRLAPVIAEEFGVAEEEVALDLALSPIWDLARGRIGDVGVQVTGFEATTPDGTVLIDPLGVALLGVSVDLSAVLGGSVDQVRFSEGVVFARLPFEPLATVMRPALQREGIDLVGLAGDGSGALMLSGSLTGVPDSGFTVRAVLQVTESAVVLTDAEVVDGRSEAQALVARADLRIDVPELPAGIVLDEAATDEGAVRVRGSLPSPLVLALLG